MSEFRKLTELERQRAAEQPSKRTKSEKKAYHLLPQCMRKNLKRNPPIAFADVRIAYFPDLFFLNERFCIEIDGRSHKEMKVHDKIKDYIFKKHGFDVIRINNSDTRVNFVFWQELLCSLKKLKIDEDRQNLKTYIKEIEAFYNKELKDMTALPDEDEW